MSISRFIVLSLALAPLMLPSGVGTVGAVLCVEADGQTEVEEHGCVCTSTHATDRTVGEEVESHHAATNLDDEHCEPCVDIPLGSEIEIYRARSAFAKRTELGSLFFAKKTGLVVDHPSSSLASASISYHSNAHLIDVGSIPLRV